MKSFRIVKFTLFFGCVLEVCCMSPYSLPQNFPTSLIEVVAYNNSSPSDSILLRSLPETTTVTTDACVYIVPPESDDLVTIIETVYVTITSTAKALNGRDLGTITVTNAITCSPGDFTIIYTTDWAKITVISFLTTTEYGVDAETKSSMTAYSRTTTVPANGCDTIFTQTITSFELEITMTTTLTSPSPGMIQMAREIAPIPREVTKRDLVWITLYEPAATATLHSTCTVFYTVSVPGQTVTVTVFVPYNEPALSHQPSNSQSSSLSQHTILPIMSSDTKTRQPGTLTTTFGTKPATIVGLPGGSLALVNGATLSQGGPATTINDQVISFGPSGLVAIDPSTPLSSAFTTTIGSAALSLTELPGEAVVDGATISSGGAGTTINGVVVTYGPSRLVASPTGSGSATAIGLGGIITSLFGNDNFASTSEIAIDTQALTLGGELSASGTVNNLPTDGTVPDTTSEQVASISSTGTLQITSGSRKEKLLFFLGIAALMFMILVES